MLPPVIVAIVVPVVLVFTMVVLLIMWQGWRLDPTAATRRSPRRNHNARGHAPGVARGAVRLRPMVVPTARTPPRPVVGRSNWQRWRDWCSSPQRRWLLRQWWYNRCAHPSPLPNFCIVMAVLGDPRDDVIRKPFQEQSAMSAPLPALPFIVPV